MFTYLRDTKLLRVLSHRKHRSEMRSSIIVDEWSWTLCAISHAFLSLHGHEVHLVLVGTEGALRQLGRGLHALVKRVYELSLIDCGRRVSIVGFFYVQSPLLTVSHRETAALVPLKHGFISILRR
jgi:hypothetical protein